RSLIGGDVEICLAAVERFPVLSVCHFRDRIDHGLHLRFGLRVQQAAAHSTGVEFGNHGLFHSSSNSTFACFLIASSNFFRQDATSSDSALMILATSSSV